VYVYRVGQYRAGQPEPQLLEDPETLDGEDVLPGFIFPVEDVLPGFVFPVRQYIFDLP
jgi:hypothetical protein